MNKPDLSILAILSRTVDKWGCHELLAAIEMIKRHMYGNDYQGPVGPVPTQNQAESLLDNVSAWDRSLPPRIDVNNDLDTFREIDRRWYIQNHGVDALSTSGYIAMPSTSPAAVVAWNTERTPRRAADAVLNSIIVAAQRRSEKNKPAGDPGTAPDKLSLAIAKKYKHPDWTSKQIAEAVGCSPAYLSKQPKWQAVLKACQSDRIEAKNRSSHHRGNDLDQYEARTTVKTPLLQCECGDPAGTDADGAPLVHENKPRCWGCWAELRQKSQG